MSISKLQMLCASKIQNVWTLPSSITRQRFSVHLFPEKRFLRLASTEQRNTKVVIPQTKPKDGQVSTVTQKVKQAGKDATYLGIVIAGLGITGAMFFWIGRELFSGQSPSGVYGKALKECLNNTEVVSVLGEPVKGYGEMTRRGRRRYVSHSEYELEGIKHMRMKFYVEGPFRKGTVHLEVKMNDRGVYEYRYLFIELDGYPSRTIIIQDNR